MKMKITFILTLFFNMVIATAQSDVAINGMLSLGGSFTSVKFRNAYDYDANWNNNGYGNSYRGKDGVAVGFSLLGDFYMKKGFGLYVGMGFMAQQFSIYNRNRSSFSVGYLQIPVGLTYLSPELIDKLKLYGRFGVSLDFKLSEKLIGSDDSYYWALAKNNDPYYIQNGDYKSMALFSPFRAGLQFQVGAEYALEDNLRPFIGIGFVQGMNNSINPKLRYNDPAKTYVADHLYLSMGYITMDLGVRF